ncbi:ankyrin repeat-containing domain protein [Endogone sp. FLAS-F59071]|nr:ankyrin repeat-containing domain protein [Endogone sp. FLAS-F59071]|eukprot:RUS14904.1 ankyrin repeat-containing domain protein [Endogone sp. FLAS-F59071]
MTQNIGKSENSSFNNVNINGGGSLYNGVGKVYNFHGNEHAWMDSAQQDELYEKAMKIFEPLKKMRFYSRILGVDPMRKDIRVRGRNGYIPADELVHIAAKLGDCLAIDLLNTKYDARVNIEHQDGWRPIHRAAEGGQVETMNMLAGRYEVDVGQRTDENSRFTFLHSKLALLHIAASQGRLKVIDLLAGKMGAQTVTMGSLQSEEKENENPFPATEDDDTVQPSSRPEGSNPVLLHPHNLGPNPNGDAAQPRVRIIVWTLGDPNVRSNDKWTAMHFAALNDKRNVEETITKLIGIGVKVNLKDIDKWTPLHFAACKGNWIAVQTLLENGADINARCRRPYGATPLYIARMARKNAVEKKEVDKYALVIAILKGRDARDRSTVDKYVGKYSAVLHLRGLLELIAWDMVDEEWVKRFSRNIQRGQTFRNENEAANFVNTAGNIDLGDFITSSIRYNILIQVLVLSVLLVITVVYSILEIQTVQQNQFPDTDPIWVTARCSTWVIVLSVFEILAHFIFGVKAGNGKPSGTVAHYLLFLFSLAILWILLCIPVHYDTVFCDNYVDILYGDSWVNILCNNLNVAEALTWTVFAFHLLHILLVFIQAYKYFPPELVSEEEVAKVLFVGGEPVLPQACEFPPFSVQTQA